ncbi:MAG: DUF1801 domain-containing protein [Thermoplasmata archaeon]|nr:DUF1801 domain-containing protein [Thermoplasmata archaeon]
MAKKKGGRKSLEDGGGRAVDEYLKALTPEMKAALERVRTLVRRSAPAAEELISYKMPAFRYQGRLLVWYAGFKDHASFFPGSLAGLRELEAEIRPYASAKGTMHFTAERPLPASLISRIVKARMASIASLAPGSQRDSN